MKLIGHSLEETMKAVQVTDTILAKPLKSNNFRESFALDFW